MLESGLEASVQVVLQSLMDTISEFFLSDLSLFSQFLLHLLFLLKFEIALKLFSLSLFLFLYLFFNAVLLSFLVILSLSPFKLLSSFLLLCVSVFGLFNVVHDVDSFVHIIEKLVDVLGLPAVYFWENDSGTLLSG